MPDMQTSQRCKHIEKTRPGHWMRKTQRKRKNKRSLKSTRDDETDIQGNLYERRKSLKSMKRRPMLLYDVLVEHHSCASYIESWRLCASTMSRREGHWTGQVRASQVSTEDRYHSLAESLKRKQRTVVGNQCPIQIHHRTHRAQRLSHIAGQACWEVGGKGSVPLPGAGCCSTGSWCTAG